jgi:hypothetical protein
MVYIISDEGEALEVYGFKEFIPGQPIIGNAWTSPKYIYNWKEKGPWVKHIKRLIKTLKKEVNTTFKQVRKFQAEVCKQKRIKKQQDRQARIEKFSKGFK